MIHGGAFQDGARPARRKKAGGRECRKLSLEKPALAIVVARAGPIRYALGKDGDSKFSGQLEHKKWREKQLQQPGNKRACFQLL